MNILFVGAGALGGALSSLIKDPKYNISMWDANPSIVPNQEPFEKLVSLADVIFVSVPTGAVRDVLSKSKEFLSQTALVVLLSKGIEEQTCMAVTEIAQGILSSHAIILISGPMLAKELSAGKGGAGVVASAHRKEYETIYTLFARSTLQLEYSDDIIGVTYSGVLKNLYAIVLGIADALECGDNMRGLIMQRSLSEMADMIESLGGKRETVYGPAGLGDLVATGFGQSSRNRSFGEEIVRSGNCSSSSEGCIALPSMLCHLRNSNIAIPSFLLMLEAIIMQSRDVRETFLDTVFSTRPH